MPATLTSGFSSKASQYSQLRTRLRMKPSRMTCACIYLQKPFAVHHLLLCSSSLPHPSWLLFMKNLLSAFFEGWSTCFFIHGTPLAGRRACILFPASPTQIP